MTLTLLFRVLADPLVVKWSKTLKPAIGPPVEESDTRFEDYDEYDEYDDLDGDIDWAVVDDRV
jgi:hypothetical protein